MVERASGADEVELAKDFADFGRASIPRQVRIENIQIGNDTVTAKIS
jgi:hypothetical protein